jgi:hypothetical protein
MVVRVMNDNLKGIQTKQSWLNRAAILESPETRCKSQETSLRIAGTWSRLSGSVDAAATSTLVTLLKILENVHLKLCVNEKLVEHNHKWILPGK